MKSVAAGLRRRLEQSTARTCDGALRDKHEVMSAAASCAGSETASHLDAGHCSLEETGQDDADDVGRQGLGEEEQGDAAHGRASRKRPVRRGCSAHSA